MKLMVVVKPHLVNEVLAMLQGDFKVEVLDITPMPQQGDLLVVFEADVKTSDDAISFLCVVEEELGGTLVTY